MSQENVELVREAFDAYARDGLEGMLPFYDPDIEWTTTASYIEPATYRGHEGVRRYLGTPAEEFDEVHVELMEVLDAGDQVVVSCRISGRGKLSDAPVDLTLIMVSLLRDGKVVRNRNYPTRPEALEAAGLSEEATSQENVDIVREAVLRFAAGDIDGLADLYDADAFIVAPEGWPEGGRFEGRDAVMRQFARIQEEWKSQSMRMERERADAEWVVVELVWDAEGNASGVAVEMRIVGAYRVRDGKIAEGRFFWQFEEAVAAVGLAG